MRRKPVLCPLCKERRTYNTDGICRTCLDIYETGRSMTITHTTDQDAPRQRRVDYHGLVIDPLSIPTQPPQYMSNSPHADNLRSGLLSLANAIQIELETPSTDDLNLPHIGPEPRAYTTHRRYLLTDHAATDLQAIYVALTELLIRYYHNGYKNGYSMLMGIASGKYTVEELSALENRK